MEELNPPSALSTIKNKLMVHFSTAEYCLCSQDHFVFSYDYKSQRLQKVCKIPPVNNRLPSIIKDKIRRSIIARSLSNSMGLGHVV